MTFVIDGLRPGRCKLNNHLTVGSHKEIQNSGQVCTRLAFQHWVVNFIPISIAVCLLPSAVTIASDMDGF